ncbi:MAG: hypothetical protein QF570_09015 [Myxococcota bacterium]|jgi:hypothetical protein|nr:hypothetical protein [Myxococcota bacterium]
MNSKRKDLDTWILLLLGVAMLANALWMFAGPMHWYQEVPAAVPDTGPFNPHFVRDIGCAFFAAGVALVWGARSAAYRFPLVVSATVFLAAHALLHIYDTSVGNLPSDHWWIDFAGVYLPVILLGFVLWRLQPRATHD